MIEVVGADAATFLQGQLTQDVDRIGEVDGLLAAWCSSKGRVIVTLRLARLAEGIGMVLPGNMADRVMDLIRLYRFRAKFDVSIVDVDPGTLVDAAHLDPAARIRAGVPEIDADTAEAFTPHMLNLDKLDAVSFTKGCYTGQEIVARTEHRGSSKRRLMRYQSDADGIRPGMPVTDGDRAVGEVVNACDRDCLAVTPVASHSLALTVAGREIRPLGLPYRL